jgi:phosphoglycolate phosphatase-like HAD superfamily hydrolase
MTNASYPTYREHEPTIEERLQAAYERGRTEERDEIRTTVQSKGYAWSHDPATSGVQHVLNWLEERGRNLRPAR